MVLFVNFILVPLTVQRVLRRVQDATQEDIIYPASYFMPYTYLPLNRRYESHIVLKLWSAFKILTSTFFIVCPICLLGKSYVYMYIYIYIYISAQKIIDLSFEDYRIRILFYM